MSPEYLRDAAGVAAVFGFFAMTWFGWAQEGPPAKWRWPLRIGVIVSAATMVAGGLLLWRHWDEGTVFDDGTGRAFGIIVGVEFGLAGIGAAFLAIRKRADDMPAWIAFIVGVHLFPVAVVLENPSLHIPAALVTAASIASVFVARARSLAVSAVVGASAGLILVVSALVALVDALTR